MRWCMIEAAKPTDSGSAGAAWVRHHAERAGQAVDMIAAEIPRYGYDVELISVHHQRDYVRLRTMPKRGKVRIIGGHVTYTNPRPLVPLADVICCGDGETWISQAVTRLRESGNDVRSLRDVPGTILTGEWQRGQALPELTIEQIMPDNPPHRSTEGNSPHWCLEIARGCPYRCAFCEIGNIVPFRFRDIEQIEQHIENIPQSEGKKIRLICPEEASHPQYQRILCAIDRQRLSLRTGGYRIEQLLRQPDLSFVSNQSLRLGIDGLTEATRKRVNKPITDKQIVAFFKAMIERGHVKFKLYQMFGYSWETEQDFQEWERLMGIVFRLPLKKSVILEITWTPFVPHIGTPLATESGDYHEAIARQIERWHKKVIKPRITPGWYVNITRIIPKVNHDEIVMLSKGDETILLRGAKWIHPAWRNL